LRLHLVPLVPLKERDAALQERFAAALRLLRLLLALRLLVHRLLVSAALRLVVVLYSAALRLVVL